jgi:hypothetical protein
MKGDYGFSITNDRSEVLNIVDELNGGIGVVIIPIDSLVHITPFITPKKRNH